MTGVIVQVEYFVLNQKTFAVKQKGGKMVKVFTTNERGKIEFTREELEALLNEVWNDGYNHHGTYWWTSPTLTAPSITLTTTCE